MLEKVDEDLLRGIIKANSKIPTELLYLETGSLPIRFILKSRRISYLYTILKRHPEELIKEIYDVQKNDPLKGDFYELVMKDIEAINWRITENEIKVMKKEKLKSIVKRKVREAALLYLKQQQQKHSKAQKISYEKLEISNYMNSLIFTSENTKLLLALRTRTVNGIRTDFKSMFSTLLCPLCDVHLDTLPNLLQCDLLRAKRRTDATSRNNVTFNDIYSSDIRKQKEITELYSDFLRIRRVPQLQSLDPCINLQEQFTLSYIRIFIILFCGMYNIYI